MRTRTLALPVASLLAFGLTACGDNLDGKAESAAGGPIQVTATDTTCEVGAKESPAGTITFEITNKGTRINEFYVYAEGDRIVGEVENVAPGLKRTFHVEVAEPGKYQTACKPGMVGDGIRSDFTVTGSSAAAKSDDELMNAATAAYAKYVAVEADSLLAKTKEFVETVKAKDVEKAKALYPYARMHWERIEPVAESFGDLDPKIDGREDVIEEGMKFTGYHRLEKDLWVTGLQADSAAIADQLLADVQEIVTKSKAVKFNGLQLANGSKALLDEMATGKITGEEERYSHTDIYDFAANWEGSKQAIASLRPVLKARAPELLTSYDAKAKTLSDLLLQQVQGEGYKLYTDIPQDQIKALSAALDAVSEDVSKVAGVVAGK